MKRRWVPLLGGLALLAAAQSAPPATPDGLYFFFTPQAPGIDRIAAQLSKVDVRPVLLVDDAQAPLPDRFLDAVKSLGRSLAGVDPEGLDLVRRFGAKRVPCLIPVHQGRVHGAIGSDLSVEEVMKCSR